MIKCKRRFVTLASLQE